MGINAIGNLLSHIRRRPLALGWYARLLGKITPALPGYLLNFQVLCAGVVVLVITILSFVMYFSAKGPKAEVEAEAYIETELVRRNAIVIFMCIEMMLNAVNLTFITFSRYLNSLDGQIFVFLVMTVAAVEVAVGLAIVVSIFRLKETTDVDEINLMKW